MAAPSACVRRRKLGRFRCRPERPTSIPSLRRFQIARFESASDALRYERQFGAPYAPLNTSCEAVDRFASTTHAVAARLDGQSGIELYTPYGLEALLAFRVVPNRRTDNRETHERKAARASAVWPELVVEPW